MNWAPAIGMDENHRLFILVNDKNDLMARIEGFAESGGAGGAELAPARSLGPVAYENWRARQ